MSTSAVTAMPNAHFTSSPITSPPSARTCRSAHVRPRSLPCISRSPRPSLMARVALQSASPDSSSQMTIEQTEGFCPKAAEVLKEAEIDALAYLDFPYEHHVRLRTNNVQERANRAPKRRSRVVQVFPNRKSPIGMMRAMFSEKDEDWAGLCCFDDDSIGRAVEGAKDQHAEARLRGHRRRARGQDHRARCGRQPRSRRGGGVTLARMTAF